MCSSYWRNCHCALKDVSEKLLVVITGVIIVTAVMHTATKYDFFTCLPHLNKSDLALTNITAGVSDGDLPIVLNPALSTENVVDAGRHLVPLIVVSKSRKRKLKTTLTPVDIASSLKWPPVCTVRVCVCALAFVYLCVSQSEGKWGSRDSPRQIYMSGPNRNDLHRLPPELVLTPHIYKINQKKAFYTFTWILDNQPLLIWPISLFHDLARRWSFSTLHGKLRSVGDGWPDVEKEKKQLG